MASVDATSLVHKGMASGLNAGLRQHSLAAFNDSRQRKYLNTNIIARRGVLDMNCFNLQNVKEILFYVNLMQVLILLKIRS
jgi:hypothetical protein